MLQTEKKKKIPARRYQRVIVALVVLAVLAAGLIGAVVQKMTRPAQIVYTDEFITDTGTQIDIMVVNADGNAYPVDVSLRPFREYDGDWLPDGSMVTFTSDNNGHGYNVFQVSADGSNLRQLPFSTEPGGYDVTFSPNSRQVLFSGYNNEQWDIWRSDVDGSHRVNLTNNGGLAVNPAWSPDGTRIAYKCGWGICIISSDGTQLHRIAGGDYGLSPQWSPDGKHIAAPCDPLNLCVMAADGSSRIRIGRNLSRYNTFDWSPDGTRLVFVDNVSPKNTEIYLVDADGSNPVNLTRHPGNDKDPAWSPDGTQIAFVSNRDSSPFKRDEIYVMNADGTGVRRITYTESFKTAPHWRPDPCGAWDLVCYLTRP